MQKFILLLLFTAGIALSLMSPTFGETFSEPNLLPEGLKIEDEFKPGYGAALGKTQLVKNEVILLHSNIFKGYRAKKNLPLFQMDTITTLEESRIRFRLHDHSIINLGPISTLTLTKSIYDPNKKRRESYIRMGFGKICFLVAKFIDYRYSGFKIKTPTAILGVRGSLFFVEATPEITKVTALEDTEIEVLSLAFLDAKPTIVKSYQQTVVRKGFLPTEPVDALIEDIEKLRQDVLIEEAKSQDVIDDKSKVEEPDEAIDTEESEMSESENDVSQQIIEDKVSDQSLESGVPIRDNSIDYEKISESIIESLQDEMQDQVSQGLGTTPLQSGESSAVTEYDELIELQDVELIEIPEQVRPFDLEEKFEGTYTNPLKSEKSDDIKEALKFEGTGSYTGSW